MDTVSALRLEFARGLCTQRVLFVALFIVSMITILCAPAAYYNQWLLFLLALGLFRWQWQRLPRLNAIHFSKINGLSWFDGEREHAILPSAYHFAGFICLPSRHQDRLTYLIVSRWDMSAKAYRQLYSLIAFVRAQNPCHTSSQCGHSPLE